MRSPFPFTPGNEQGLAGREGVVLHEIVAWAAQRVGNVSDELGIAVDDLKVGI